jgi:hypothetical protein
VRTIVSIENEIEFDARTRATILDLRSMVSRSIVALRVRSGWIIGAR